jgi:hypothetical protein
MGICDCLHLTAPWPHLFFYTFKGMDDKNATKLNELIQVG